MYVLSTEIKNSEKISDFSKPFKYAKGLLKYQEAVEVQRELAEKVIVEDLADSIQIVGGMDVSCNLYDPHQMIYASTVALSYENLQVVETSSVAEKQTFPYIPGLLSFRESPSLIRSFEKLQKKPDVLLIDGQGICHPRGLGIASHIGVLLDIPTIGVAKSILVGEQSGELGKEVGSQLSLIWKGKTVAMSLRTKRGSNPLIISIGHRISLQTAVEVVKRCLKGYRLPEATRQAHIAANQHRRSRTWTP